MVQGVDGCTMVTGASDSIGPLTSQPLRFMCSGAVLPLQCFTLGVPTARHPADLWPALLYNAVVPCWRTFARKTRHPPGSVSVAKRRSCGVRSVLRARRVSWPRKVRATKFRCWL